MLFLVSDLVLILAVVLILLGAAALRRTVPLPDECARTAWTGENKSRITYAIGGLMEGQSEGQKKGRRQGQRKGQKDDQKEG